MKKKMITILLTLALLAGCQSQAPAPSVTDTPDVEEIIQQEVDKAVQEKLKEYEEEQKKKDEEIDQLKKQLEERGSSSEVPPEETPPASSGTSQPEPQSSSSQADAPPQEGLPPQPEPDPAPSVKPANTARLNEGTVFEGYEVKVTDWTTPAVSSGGRDWPITTWYFWGPGETVLGSISGKALEAITDKYHAAMNYDPEVDWSIWYAEAFNEYRNLANGSTPTENPDSTGEPVPAGGSYRLEDAEEVIRLTNQERVKNGLEPLEVDEDLMELAKVRAVEIKEQYSHTRPDGTSVVDLGCGENCGRRYSVEEQIKGWMNSEGHRTNILLDRYHHIGAACYQAENGNLYWVQVFSLD